MVKPMNVRSRLLSYNKKQITNNHPDKRHDVANHMCHRVSTETRISSFHASSNICRHQACSESLPVVEGKISRTYQDTGMDSTSGPDSQKFPSQT